MRKRICTFLMSGFLLVTTPSCEYIKENPDVIVDIIEFFLYALGWDGTDDLSEVPESTEDYEVVDGEVPVAVDLTSKFPPIGDQGQYGTCVAWASAYNMKTAANAIDNNWGTSQLSRLTNQASPKDLFLAISNDEKGGSCGGTNFTTALSVLQERGVASMQTVPYASLGNCSDALVESNWTTEANQNKIGYWRIIDPTIESIKTNIANKYPVLLGAKLADNFMSWDNSSVISSHTSYDNVGQHAYHAMVIAGYNDNKGPNGAFKVINSWGNIWGDEGYIWVDYNFMINDLCIDIEGYRPLFIMSNDDTPQEARVAAEIKPYIYDRTNGEATNDRTLSFRFIIEEPSENTSYYYIYYNAYKAKDYGVLYSGGALAEDEYATYNMPALTGKYYLALVEVEGGQASNIYYPSTSPIEMLDGKFDEATIIKATQENEVTQKNGYTKSEVLSFLNRELKSGRL